MGMDSDNEVTASGGGAEAAEMEVDGNAVEPGDDEGGDGSSRRKHKHRSSHKHRKSHHRRHNEDGEGAAEEGDEGRRSSSSRRRRDKDKDKDKDRSRDKEKRRRSKRSASRSPSRSRSRSRSPRDSRRRRRSSSRDRRTSRSSRRHNSRSPSPGRGPSRGNRSRSRSFDRYRRRSPPGYSRYGRGDHRRYGGGGGGAGMHRRSRSPPRDRTPPEVRAAAAYERELRTVLVYSLAPQVTNEDLKQFFAVAGKASKVELIVDKQSGRSKGFGYVEFESRDSVPAALSMTGTPIAGIPILVKPSEAEKNLAAQNEGAGGSLDKGPNRLYVGNLDSKLTENDLRPIFFIFGEPTELKVIHAGHYTHVFVTYRSSDEAKSCLDELHNMSIAGKKIKVGFVNEFMDINAPSMQHLQQLPNIRGMGPNGVAPGMTGVTIQASTVPPPPPPSAPSTSSVDMMPQQSGPSPASCNVLLENMFDPAEESGEDFDIEIRDDVVSECSQYGDVLFVHVDKHHKDGLVYLKFVDMASAGRAIEKLNGRWFSGKRIKADYVGDIAFERKFPEIVGKELKPIRLGPSSHDMSNVAFD